MIIFSGIRTWTTAYPNSTLVTTHNCLVCHTDMNGSNWNSYGNAILTKVSSGSSYANAIKAVEPLDSDGDTFTNLVEINANTLPGDATSHPATDSETTPSAPANLTASPISSTEIDLTWDASVDNVAVTGYKVYRNGALVASPSSPSFADTGLTPSTPYQYYVKATDAANNLSAASNTVSRSTPATPVVGAALLSSTLPAHLLRGATTSVTLTFQNTGSTAWTSTAGFALASQDPADNQTWGLNRVPLAPSDSIASGAQKSFTFNLTAPDSVGMLSCDWQMLQQGAGPFGALASASVEVTSFDDVPMSSPLWSYIEAVRTANITQGCDATHFCPSAPVSRAQMALFLARSITGLDAYTPPATSPFADVPTTSVAYPAVCYIADPTNPTGRAITLGCDATHFCPDDTVTRAQMALFLARSIGGFDTYTPPATSQFTDVATDSVAYPAISYIADASHNAVGRAITLGCDATHYCPDRTVTRDQMAAFLARAFLKMN